jgi:hypothetical protein
MEGSKPRREAQEGHRVLRRELLLHASEERGRFLAGERVRFFLRVDLVLGGVERADALGWIE